MAATSTPNPGGLSAMTVLADLAVTACLSAAEISETDELLDLGIDSVRLMGLVERWRFQGSSVEFGQLAANPTVGEAVDLVCIRSATRPHR